MYEKKTTIINEAGLHARPASELVKKAKTYEANVTIRKLNEELSVDAKSLLRVLAGGFIKDTQVAIAADGSDEVKAVEELVGLVRSGFGEEV